METKFKKVHTKKEIENDPRVSSIHQEDDGCWETPAYWCYLKSGWQAYGNQQHTIHERTIKDICDELNYCVTEWKDDPELNPKS